MRRFLTAGQRSDYIGARVLWRELLDAKHMLADRGYDADWHREALENKGIKPCIPSRKSRKVPIPHDEARYRKPLRPLPQGVPVGMRISCRGHVLVMNPDPR